MRLEKLWLWMYRVMLAFAFLYVAAFATALIALHVFGWEPQP